MFRVGQDADGDGVAGLGLGGERRLAKKCKDAHGQKNQEQLQRKLRTIIHILFLLNAKNRTGLNEYYNTKLT